MGGGQEDPQINFFGPAQKRLRFLSPCENQVFHSKKFEDRGPSGLAGVEYDRTKGFSSSAGAELFKTHVRLTEAEAELLKLKFG